MGSCQRRSRGFGTAAGKSVTFARPRQNESTRYIASQRTTAQERLLQIDWYEAEEDEDYAADEYVDDGKKVKKVVGAGRGRGGGVRRDRYIGGRGALACGARGERPKMRDRWWGTSLRGIRRRWKELAASTFLPRCIRKAFSVVFCYFLMVRGFRGRDAFIALLERKTVGAAESSSGGVGYGVKFSENQFVCLS